MTYLKKLALGAALVGAAGVAEAATVTFDFTTANRGASSSLNYTAGGLTLTVSATGGDGKVQTWAGSGLGVPDRDYHFVDSTYSPETVVFDFSKLVKLVKVTFAYVDPWDDFKLTQEGVSLGVFDVLASVNTTTGLADTFGIGADGKVTGNYVSADDYDKACVNGTWATSYTDTCYSAFKIKSITVDVPDPAPVPLPAAGVMLLAALGGLGLAKRRKA